jgi:hypothetical protein
MTSLGTLQWIPSCWIQKKALSTSSLQWQTWTSKIQTKHYGFQSSNPFLPLVCYFFNSLLCASNWSYVLILFQPPKSIEFDNVKPSLAYDFFRIQSINMIPLVQFKDVINLDVYKRCENKSRKTWYSLIQERFFDYLYKVWFLPSLSIWICQFFCLKHVMYKNLFFLVQHELLAATNVIIKLYYEEVLDEKLRSPSLLQNVSLYSKWFH